MSENKDTMADDAIEWLNEIRCWINRCKDTEWGDDDQRIVDFITSALQSPRVLVIDGFDEAIATLEYHIKINGSQDWFLCGYGKQILEFARAYAEWPKIKRVNLDEMKQHTTCDGAHKTERYNAAIDDIKSKYGDLYVEVKNG